MTVRRGGTELLTGRRASLGVALALKTGQTSPDATAAQVRELIGYMTHCDLSQADDEDVLRRSRQFVLCARMARAALLRQHPLLRAVHADPGQQAAWTARMQECYGRYVTVAPADHEIRELARQIGLAADQMITDMEQVTAYMQKLGDALRSAVRHVDAAFAPLGAHLDRVDRTAPGPDGIADGGCARDET
jgi:hypothetical protein